MNSTPFSPTLLQAQRQQLRWRSVLFTVLGAELIALVLLETGFGFAFSLVVAALVGVWLVFWPSIIGMAMVIGNRTARWARALRRAVVGWKDRRFRFGLRSVQSD